MKKRWQIIPIVFLGIFLSACSNHASQNNANSKAIQVTPITRTDYNHIKLANITTPNKGGTSQSAIIRRFGKPSATKTISITGQSKKHAVQYTWHHLAKSFKATSLTVEFLSKHAVSKSYLLANNQRKLTAASTLNAIKPGTSYQQVMNRLGFPVSESKTGSGRSMATDVLYVTNKKGNATSLMFIANKLQSKTSTRVN